MSAAAEIYETPRKANDVLAELVPEETLQAVHTLLARRDVDDPAVLIGVHAGTTAVTVVDRLTLHAALSSLGDGFERLARPAGPNTMWAVASGDAGDTIVFAIRLLPLAKVGQS